MPIKYTFALLVLVAMTGCVLDQHSTPNVVSAPPYLQSQNEMSQRQMAEMRAFHEKESAKTAEEMHIVHNSEMERLRAAGKDIEKDRLWQEDYEKTVERREKWAGLFKKKSKDDATAVSSRTDEKNKKVR